MVAIYLVIAALAVVITAVFVDQLPDNLQQMKKTPVAREVGEMCMATLKQMRQISQLLLIPITILSGLEQSFFSAEFTKVKQLSDKLQLKNFKITAIFSHIDENYYLFMYIYTYLRLQLICSHNYNIIVIELIKLINAHTYYIYWSSISNFGACAKVGNSDLDSILIKKSNRYRTVLIKSKYSIFESLCVLID